jgi:hypothetical protein
MSRQEVKDEIKQNEGDPLKKAKLRSLAKDRQRKSMIANVPRAMLPKEDSGVFGSGTAGDVWRSMLAEQLAKQLGKSVDLGLGKTASAGRASSQAMAPPSPPAQQRS